jgi:hypothetical protein
MNFKQFTLGKQPRYPFKRIVNVECTVRHTVRNKQSSEFIRNILHKFCRTHCQYKKQVLPSRTTANGSCCQHSKYYAGTNMYSSSACRLKVLLLNSYSSVALKWCLNLHSFYSADEFIKFKSDSACCVDCASV